MIREWIKRVALMAYDEHYARISQPMESNRQAISGNPLVTIHKLSNGYLLSSYGAPYLSESQTLVFCENVADIGDYIIAMETRTRMGVPGHVNMNAKQQRDVAAMQQQKYTP